MVGRALRRLFLPSPHEPAARQVPMAAQLRMAIAALAGVAIVVAYFSYRDAPGADGRVLFWNAVAGVLAFALDVALAWLLLKRPHLLFLQDMCIVLEVSALIVGGVVYGLPTTGFNTVVAVLVWMQRMVSYRASLTCVASYFILGTVAFALEKTGTLRAGLALAVPARMGSSWVSPLLETFWFALLVFGGANAYATRLFEKDHELVSIKNDLAEVARGGRFVGRTVGGHLLVELLGRGGMGEVYAAGDVAVKVLHPHLGSEMRERFAREAELMEQVSSSPRVIGKGTTDDGLAYVAMERLRGEDLAALLRKQRVPPREGAALVEKIARALDEAHALGIVHRDLKPQNVFLETSGGVRLLDFGVARAPGSALTQPLALLGSPGYLAPEQARGALDEIDPRTDVFALGAIAYRLLTGQNAFPGRHPAAAVYESHYLDPEPPSRLVPELPAEVDHVIALALAKRREDRYASAGDFARDLARAVEGSIDLDVRDRARGLAPAAPPAGTLTT